MHGKRTLIVVIGVVAGIIAGVRGGRGADARRTSRQRSRQPRDNYDELFARFLRDSRSTAARPGEAWSWMAGLTLDPRARQVNDLITIRVIESIAASGTADSALDKSSDAKHRCAELFGAREEAAVGRRSGQPRRRQDATPTSRAAAPRPRGAT